MVYRSELDGLRALAVMAVIFFHSGVSGFSGGYVGVDIFFVLSGYLITQILCQSLESGRFSLIDFYERRARRLLPALLTVIGFTLIASWWLLPSSYLSDTAQSAIATLVFGSNFFFWQQSGYFDTANGLKPLLHTWSLAVEEQFYLLFPLLLALGWRRFNSALRGLMLAITAISFSWCAWGDMDTATRFYLLPTRLWELMIGALCAVYSSQLRALPINRNLLTLACSALLVYAITQLDAHTPFPGVHALAPTVGAAGLILFAQPNTWIGRLLSLRPMVHIGLISYSAYLWHQPLLAFWHFQQLEAAPLWQVLLFITLILFIAHLSWRWIEQPFRQRQAFSQQAIFRYSACGIGVLLIAAVLINITPLQQQRQFSYQHLEYDLDNPSLRKQTWQALRALAADSRYGVTNNTFDQSLWFAKDDTRPGLLIVGNSYSKDMYNVLHASAIGHQRYQLARYGAQIAELAEQQHPFYLSPNYRAAHTVLIASRYTSSDVNALPVVLARLKADGKRAIVASLAYEFPEYSGKNWADIQYLRHDRSTAATIDGTALSETINRAHYNWLEQGLRPDIDQINQQLQTITQQYQAIFVDRMAYLCDAQQQQCFAVNSKLQKYYFDYGHHTLVGAEYFASRIDALNWLP